MQGRSGVTIGVHKLEQQVMNETTNLSSVSAVALAHMLDHDAVLDNFAEQDFANQESSKKAGCVYALHFKRTFNNPQLEAMPVPGSKAGKNGIPEHPNYAVDKYRGETDKTDRSWWLDFADNMPTGVRLDWYRRAVKGVMSKDPIFTDVVANPDSATPAMELYGRMIEKEWYPLPIPTLEKKLITLNNRRTRVSANCKKGWRILAQWRAIETQLGDVASVDFVWQDPEVPEAQREIDDTQFCIRLSAVKVANLYHDFSENEFLALNIDKTIQDGRTFTKLVQSGKKKKQPKSGQGAATPPDAPGKVAVSVSNFNDTMNQVATFMDDPDQWTNWLKTVSKAKPSDMNDIILTLGDIYYGLAGFCDKNETLYNTLKQGQKAKLEAEIAAKARAA